MMAQDKKIIVEIGKFLKAKLIDCLNSLFHHNFILNGAYFTLLNIVF